MLHFSFIVTNLLARGIIFILTVLTDSAIDDYHASFHSFELPLLHCLFVFFFFAKILFSSLMFQDLEDSSAAAKNPNAPKNVFLGALNKFVWAKDGSSLLIGDSLGPTQKNADS